MKVDRLDEAERELAEAFALGERTDERFAEAELYRNRVAILVLRAAREAATRKRGSAAARNAAARQAEAAGCMEKAISVAQAQGALWWELRATVDLCRLWNSQRRRPEARAFLERVYARFSPDVPAMDLREASALLAELRGA